MFATRLVKRLGVLSGIALCAVPLAAQQPPTVELGAFGRHTAFDGSLALKDRPGLGGRLGVFFVPNLAIEGTGSFTPTEAKVGGADVSYVPLHARLVYHLPVSERLAVLVGAGFVHNEYGNTANLSDNGANSLLGVRYRIQDHVSLRLEGLADYLPSPANGASDNWNFGLQAGVSVLLGGAKDTDGDGVADQADRCPTTPLGEAVGPDGCSLDGDRDGVVDSRDRCPGTPAGELVSEAGCPRDGDRDGVRDSADRCPDTPAGERVDANGCPMDTDGDGVRDAADRCADTPRGVAVDASGCPLDTDGDRVADHRDRCAATPRGAIVNENGCSRDGDGDGVADGIDRCPNTARGSKVDATGCAALFEADAAAVVLKGVNFETGSARLTRESQAILDAVAESLTANPGFPLEVAGHTDNTGSRAGNTTLSQARADAVRAYLIGRGVAAARLTAKGYGPDQPIADNATAEGRAENRRVELKRLGR